LYPKFSTNSARSDTTRLPPTITTRGKGRRLGP